MSAREAVIAEINAAPESMVLETYDFVLSLKSKSGQNPRRTKQETSILRPDFLARQKAVFGDRVLSHSQAILDEQRADRF